MKGKTSQGTFQSPQGLLALSFDLFGRYATIQALIDELRGEQGQRFNILDVGGYIEGHGASLQEKFFLRDRVTVLDKRQCDRSNYVKGDALQLPFSNQTFDIVFSADVLEHIAPPERPLFLKEQFRTSKRYIILAAPFQSKLTERAENDLSWFYSMLFGEPHPYLQEHRTYGLPEHTLLENFCIKNKAAIRRKFPNNHLPFWRLLMRASFYAQRNPEIMNELEQINAWYNATVFPCDTKEPCYRTIYLIDKTPSARVFSLEQGEAQNFSWEEALLKLEHDVFDLIAKGNRMLRKTNQALVSQSQELTAIHASRTWKVLSLMRSIKNRFLALISPQKYVQ